jgi:endo-1,4-beta-xylanase
MGKNKRAIAGFLTAAIFTAFGFSGDNQIPALKNVFKNDFLVGVAVNDAIVSGMDPKAAEIVEQQFNSTTPENVMKWALIHPEPDQYNFAPADRYVAFGEKNHMFIIGHNLVWQDQIPPWAFLDSAGHLLGRDAMLARMKDHIMTVVGRYKGRINGWDVVNEALSDDGTLKETKWLKTVGPDFIAKAFEFAHEADPNAELYYNDYSLEKPAKRDAVVRLIRDLKSKGLRIDGVGIQGHWGMDYPDPNDFDAFVDSVSTLGVKVMVTELDVNILPTISNYQGAQVGMHAEFEKKLNPYPTGLPDSMQQKLADRYAEIFSMILKHADVITRVTFWGVYDRTSWLNNWPIPGRTNYPLLFGRDYQPKPAFFAVVKTAESKK